MATAGPAHRHHRRRWHFTGPHQRRIRHQASVAGEPAPTAWRIAGAFAGPAEAGEGPTQPKANAAIAASIKLRMSILLS